MPVVSFCNNGSHIYVNLLNALLQQCQGTGHWPKKGRLQ
jgi:hypothetical protein